MNKFLKTCNLLSKWLAIIGFYLLTIFGFLSSVHDSDHNAFIMPVIITIMISWLMWITIYAYNYMMTGFKDLSGDFKKDMKAIKELYK